MKLDVWAVLEDDCRFKGTPERQVPCGRVVLIVHVA